MNVSVYNRLLQSLVTAIACNEFLLFSPRDCRWHGLSGVCELLSCHLKISSRFDKKLKPPSTKPLSPRCEFHRAFWCPPAALEEDPASPSICCMPLFFWWPSLLCSPKSDGFNPHQWKSILMNHTELFCFFFFAVGIHSYTRLTGAFSFFLSSFFSRLREQVVPLRSVRCN